MRIIIFILFGGIQVLTSQVKNAYPAVEIPNTEQRSIVSSVNGQEYDLFIHFPRSYRTSSLSYPVIYLLDAQWDFSLVTSIYGQQYYDGFLPEVIIVGITWGGQSPNHDSLRAKDLTPSHHSSLIQSGGGEQFLTCMQNEIIPFIDSNYRTSTKDRTLMGSSFGGLFSLFVLFSNPELFQRYVVTSPAIGWDGEKIYSIMNNSIKKYHGIIRVYLAHGNLEGGIDRFKSFSKKMMSKNIERFEVQSHLIENSGHSGTKAEGYTRGLQFVYKRPIVNVSEKILNKYSGEYKNERGETIILIKKENTLVVQFSDGSSIQLCAVSEYSFFVTGQYLTLDFSTKPSATADGFSLEQFSDKSFFSKKK